MTDRPVADREPLSRVAVAVIGTNLVFDYGTEERARAAFDAARAHPDEAGLREALDAVLAYGAEPPEYPGMVLVPAADITRLRARATEARLLRWGRDLFAAQPAVPVAGAEDWYDRDAKAFARAHAQTGALRAAQPEDDGLDEPNWLGALILHAELVHGCDHTAQVRAESNTLPEWSEGVERRDGA